jgi:DNA-binding NarL/FixJ family response regulator
LAENALHDGSPAILALVPDLLFAARVRGAAPEARTLQSADRLLDRVGPATRLVLVDLQARGALDLIRRLRGRESPPRIIAYGPHVDADALRAAREAGADQVLARGAFVNALPSIVAEAGS